LAFDAKTLEEVANNRERHTNSDGDLPIFASSNSTNRSHRSIEMIKPKCSLLQELLPCGRWVDAGVTTLEERCPEPMLERAHAPAHGRLLNIELGGRPPEAAVISRRDCVTK
jgi:hypothetical protein